jgi:hypothetical protein
MHHRIEKSVFRVGEYVGYCDGVWRIKKETNGLWSVRKNHENDFFRASTLDGIGEGLDQRANIAASRAMFR